MREKIKASGWEVTKRGRVVATYSSENEARCLAKQAGGRVRPVVTEITKGDLLEIRSNKDGVVLIFS